MNQTFKLRLLRALRIDGHTLARGTELRTGADTALRLLCSGEATLIDDHDLAELIRHSRVNGSQWTYPTTR